MNVEWHDPKVKDATLKNDKIAVEYDFAKELLTSDGKPLRGFELAEEDELYYPAQGSILGNSIELRSDQVQEPRFFRYGYQPFSDANLINEARLPASTYASE